MPVDKGGKTPHPILEHLSTAELETLIGQELHLSDDTEPNVEYIMAIMEVIEKREAESAEAEQPDVEAAWKEFQEDYLGQADSCETSQNRERDSSHFDQIESPGKTKRPLQGFRYAVLAAAVAVLLCGAASAFGFGDMFQALMDWTAETFGFATVEEKDVTAVKEDDPLQLLRVTVEKETDTLAVPTWVPDGIEQIDEVSVARLSNRMRVSGNFRADDKEFTIHMLIYDAVPEKYTGTYQKNGAHMQLYEIDGVRHYLVENNGNNSAAWTNGVIEGHIQGNISMEDLRKMVDSIYEE